MKILKIDDYKEKMETKIEIGDKFKNRKDEVYQVIKISPSAILITAKKLDTNENFIFRFYNASGTYIRTDTPNTELGNFISK